MKKLCFTLVVAAVLWAVMFSPQTMPLINFWEMMAGSALTLAVLACLFDRSWLKESVWNPQSLLLGIALAAALWGVFWTGDKVAAWLFDFARPQVDMIYGLKESTNPLFLTLLLLLVTGPAEEIFWRGYVQRTISHRWNPNAGFAITTAVYSCTRGLMQFHAHNGGIGGRHSLGRALPPVPAAPACAHRIARRVGRSSFRVVSYLTASSGKHYQPILQATRELSKPSRVVLFSHAFGEYRRRIIIQKATGFYSKSGEKRAFVTD